MYQFNDIEEAKNADKIILLNKGRIIAMAAPDQILRDTATLDELKLDSPFALKLSRTLNEKGIHVAETLNVEELERQLCQLHAKV